MIFIFLSLYSQFNIIFFSCIISGVSCDYCMKSNFRGRRYKCLICYDYDLCAECYESNATSTRHTTQHAVQCILTRAMIEVRTLPPHIFFNRSNLSLRSHMEREVLYHLVNIKVSPVLIAIRKDSVTRHY